MRCVSQHHSRHGTSKSKRSGSKHALLLMPRTELRCWKHSRLYAEARKHGGPQGACIPPKTAVTHCTDGCRAASHSQDSKDMVCMLTSHARHLVRYPQSLKHNSILLARKSSKQHSMCLPKPWHHTMAETYHKYAASGRTARVSTTSSQGSPSCLADTHERVPSQLPSKPAGPSKQPDSAPNEDPTLCLTVRVPLPHNHALCSGV